MPNDTAEAPLMPNDAELVSLLTQVKPAEMFDVIRELFAIFESVDATRH
jgi:hypothetical protein